jgi:hypothetical protein
MTPLVNHRSTGVEELLDQIEIVLIDSINDALAEVYARRELSDIARAERRGVDYVALSYEQVPSDHFHIGNFPSLVLEEVPPDAYPYLVLTVEDFMPDAEDIRQDHINVYRDALVVHCLAKSSDEEGPEVVFRRAVRMGEAVFLALGTDPVVSRLLGTFSNPTRGQQSIPWTSQHKGRGNNSWYQAVGMSYAIKSYSTMYD